MQQLHHISAKLDELDNVIAILSERRNQLGLQRNALYLLEVFRAVPELYMLVLRGSVTYKCDAIGKYYPSWRLHVRAALSSQPERIELFGAAMDIHPERGIEDAALALSELLDKTPLSEQISELGEERADRTFVLERSALASFLYSKTVNAQELADACFVIGTPTNRADEGNSVFSQSRCQ